MAVAGPHSWSRVSFTEHVTIVRPPLSSSPSCTYLYTSPVHNPTLTGQSTPPPLTLRSSQVETYDGWRATARTFVSGPLAQLHAEVVPTERYMKQLRDGAADNYLDPLYQAWLSSIETVPSVGLGSEYYDTPAKYIAYSFLAIVSLLVAGFFVQH